MAKLLWTAKELAEHQFDDIYLFEPIVPAGGIVLLYGKRNIGKSHLILTLAACLTEGGKLFGKYPTQEGGGRVVIVQADMPEPMQQQRVAVTYNWFDLDGLFFHFPRYLSIALMREDDELVERIKAQFPDLIIWDTLRKIHRGESNADESPGVVYGKAKQLFPGITHMFVHHDKKTVVDQAQLDAEEAFRGSGAWLDDADTGIHLVDSGSALSIQFTKVRGAESQPNIPCSLDPKTMTLHSGINPLPLAEEWCAKYPTGTRDELYRYIMGSFVCSERMAARAADDMARMGRIES